MVRTASMNQRTKKFEQQPRDYSTKLSPSAFWLNDALMILTPASEETAK